MNEPKCIFENQGEAQKYLAEWQERLFLQDWTIQIHLQDDDIVEEAVSDKPLGGSWKGSHEDRHCLISLVTPNDDRCDRLTKFCHEQILIHELLHCKYGWISNVEIASREDAYFEISEHALLEQMSKSLIMAKYGVKFDWFKNF